MHIYIVHIWEYKGYPGHKDTMARLAQDPVSPSFFLKKKVTPHTHLLYQIRIMRNS